MASALRASLAPAGLGAAALSASPIGGRKEHLGASLRASTTGSHGRVTMALRARRDPRLIAPVNDKFLPWLADVARSDEGRAQISDAASGRFEGPPLLDLAAAKMAATQMAAPAQVERGGGYGEHRPRRPPPDLPSLLLNSRIVYIGMPLVPAVTELVIAQLLYLQWMDPRQPTYVYLNSTGTSRADGETVGMETEGFAIYDTMMQMKNEMQTVGVGAAIGQACMLLAAGETGRHFMLPHATAMIQQPRLPSTFLCSLCPLQTPCCLLLPPTAPSCAPPPTVPTPPDANSGRGCGDRPGVHAASRGGEGAALHAATRHRHDSAAAPALHGTDVSH
ncbi:unnamed protein product [Closterium sp. NIES-53]